MAVLERAPRLSVGEVREGGLDALFHKVEAEGDVVVRSGTEDAYAVVSLRRWQSQVAAQEQALARSKAEIEEAIMDLGILASRFLSPRPDDDPSYSLDEVLIHFGFTREQLLDLQEPEEQLDIAGV